MKHAQENKGITLIALVITIIVMLILVAVVVSVSLGDNGLFNRAKEAAQRTNAAAASEAAMGNEAGSYINSIIGGSVPSGYENPIVENAAGNNSNSSGQSGSFGNISISGVDYQYYMDSGHNNMATVTDITGSDYVTIPSSIEVAGVPYEVVLFHCSSIACTTLQIPSSITTFNGTVTSMPNLTTVYVANSTQQGDIVYTGIAAEIVSILGE